MILRNPINGRYSYFPYSLIFGPASRNLQETLELQHSFMISAYAQISREFPNEAALEELCAFIENAEELDLLDAPLNPSSLLIMALLCASINTDCKIRISPNLNLPVTIPMCDIEKLEQTWELYSCGRIQALSEFVAHQSSETPILGEMETLFTVCLPCRSDKNILVSSILDRLLFENIQHQGTFLVANVIGSVCAAFPWIPELLLLIRLQSLLKSIVDSNMAIDFTTIVAIDPKQLGPFCRGELFQFDCVTNTLGVIQSMRTPAHYELVAIGGNQFCFWR
jgi:hypothetical protein